MEEKENELLFTTREFFEKSTAIIFAPSKFEKGPCRVIPWTSKTCNAFLKIRGSTELLYFPKIIPSQQNRIWRIPSPISLNSHGFGCILVLMGADYKIRLY